MLTKLQKWNNSLAPRIPKVFAIKMKMEDSSFVEISPVKGKMIITLVQTLDWRLGELLAGITAENLHPEVETGPAIGNDNWLTVIED
jgi:antitoxin MazE